MSALMKIISQRRSIRKYKLEQPEENDIISCVEAARLAPSACNGQPWRFIVARSQKARKAVLKKCFNGPFAPMHGLAATAPVLILMLRARPATTIQLGSMISGIDYSMMDLGIAGEHLVLRAAELGLGTCWIGWFDKKAAARLIRTRKYEPAAIFTLGYPDEAPEARPRKPFNKIALFR